MIKINKNLLAVLGALVLVIQSVSAIAAAAPTDTVPNNIPATARAIDGQTQTVSANGALWYKFDYNASRDDDGHRDLTTVTMPKATGTGLGFEIYTPAQIANWWEQKPVGQGTAEVDNTSSTNGDSLSSSLTWVGSFMANGTYFVRVTNANAYAMNFSLNQQ